MEPVVRLLEGFVQGTTRTDIDGKSFYSFTCIPYGKAPVGNLRFKAPQPVEPWEGIKDATKEENVCYQNDFFKNKPIGSEDCLNLHVFTKKLPSEEKKLKPVMVHIHGGGFLLGTHETYLYGPEVLLTEDIVLVSITYRSGFLGFIHFDDLTLNVPGNAGLKDQVLALKWVQNNIKNFNGDPNNVTIFGISAGGASVEYLLLTPTAKNLFHKAIIQSGSSLNPWTRSSFNPADLAEYLGRPNISEKELLELLVKMPVHELYEIQNSYIKSKVKPGDFGVVSPIVEKPNPTAFLTEHPMDIIQSKKYNTVPVIMGYTDNEGLLFIYLQNKDQGISFLRNTEKLLPPETNLEDKEQVKKIVDTLEEFYFNENNNKLHKTMLISDACFAAGIITSARHQAKSSKHPVYLYRFTLDTNLNLFKKSGKLHDHPGACHGDDIGYFFKCIGDIEVGEPERIAQKRLITLWTNFAKFGNPTPKGNDLNIEWKPIEDDEMHFLDIGAELKMGTNPEADRMEVWKKVYRSNPRTAMY